jgi:hypothetical protein
MRILRSGLANGRMGEVETLGRSTNTTAAAVAITTTATLRPTPAKAAADLITEIPMRRKKWEAVGRALPLLTRLRMEERERRRAPEEEVENLRVRNRMEMGIGMGWEGRAMKALVYDIGMDGPSDQPQIMQTTQMYTTQ